MPKKNTKVKYCVNGHDRCNEMYSSKYCPYCEVRCIPEETSIANPPDDTYQKYLNDRKLARDKANTPWRETE